MRGAGRHPSVTVAGQNLGSVPFSYSTTSGAIWQRLQGDAGQVAQAFRNAHHWTGAQAAAALNTLRATPNQIAGALHSAYADGYDPVVRVLLNTGFSVDTAISTVKSVLGAADSQVASTLPQLGYQQTQITNLLVRFYGDGQAAIYNVLTSIGPGHARRVPGRSRRRRTGHPARVSAARAAPT